MVHLVEKMSSSLVYDILISRWCTNLPAETCDGGRIEKSFIAIERGKGLNETGEDALNVVLRVVVPLKAKSFPHCVLYLPVA